MIKKKKGFTLIDLALFIVVVGVGFVGVMGVFIESINQMDTVERLTIATNLGQKQLEKEIQGGFNDITIGTSGPFSFSSPFSEYSYTIESYYVDESDLNSSVSFVTTDFKHVQITVSHARLTDVVFVTLVSNFGE